MHLSPNCSGRPILLGFIMVIICTPPHLFWRRRKNAVEYFKFGAEILLHYGIFSATHIIIPALTINRFVREVTRDLRWRPLKAIIWSGSQSIVAREVTISARDHIKGIWYYVRCVWCHYEGIRLDQTDLTGWQTTLWRRSEWGGEWSGVEAKEG